MREARRLTGIPQNYRGPGGPDGHFPPCLPWLRGPPKLGAHPAPLSLGQKHCV